MQRSLLYLSEDEVRACLPPHSRRLELAREALLALADGSADMPLKTEVRPRPGGAVHAMPAWLRTRDVLGIKWIATYPQNSVHGAASTDAVILLNDPQTGRLTHVLEGTMITCARTAAVSGAAIIALRRRAVSRVAILGAGLQGSSHADVVRYLFPEAEIAIYDRHPERAAALAGRVRGGRRSGGAVASGTARAAVAGSDVVVSAAARGSTSQALSPDWLTDDALVVAIDRDTYASAALARSASSFVVDDRDRFLVYLQDGAFSGFPPPTDTLGDALRRSEDSHRESGRVLVCLLGFALTDLIFAQAVSRAADALGLGTLLDR